MGKRVLYAEDELTNRKLLEIKLKAVGIECDLAFDGQSALELFKTNSYKVVILDQYMPGMNGDALAREIRRVDKDTTLIAITSDDREISTLREAGFDEIFIKPLRGTGYIKTIARYVENDT
jgi:DNA-binding response OmpR family regulator